jgi:hypothetical protein
MYRDIKHAIILGTLVLMLTNNTCMLLKMISSYTVGILLWNTKYHRHVAQEGAAVTVFYCTVL